MASSSSSSSSSLASSSSSVIASSPSTPPPAVPLLDWLPSSTPRYVCAECGAHLALQVSFHTLFPFRMAPAWPDCVANLLRFLLLLHLLLPPRCITLHFRIATSNPDPRSGPCNHGFIRLHFPLCASLHCKPALLSHMLGLA